MVHWFEDQKNDTELDVENPYIKKTFKNVMAVGATWRCCDDDNDEMHFQKITGQSNRLKIRKLKMPWNVNQNA